MGRLFDLCNSHYNVALRKTALASHFNKRDDGSLSNFSGIEYDLLSTLSSVLNFSYTPKDRSEILNGHPLPNGTWDGVFGEILNGELDFSLSTLSVTDKRYEVVDFSPPYMFDRTSFFVKPQKVQSKLGLFFLDPFIGQTWFLFIIYLLIYAVILEVLLRKYYKRATTDFGLIMATSSFLRQPLTFLEARYRYNNKAFRILITIWLMTSTLLSIHYGSFLTASASVSDYVTIKTINELLNYIENSNLRIGVLSGSSYHDALTQTKFYNKMKIFDQHYYEVFLESNIVALDGEKLFLMEMSQRGVSPDKYYHIEESLFYEHFAIPFRKNFTCKDSFAAVIKLARESGWLKKWEDDMLIKNNVRIPKKLSENGQEYRPISVKDVESSFYLDIIGLVIGMIALIFEILSKFYYRIWSA